MKKLTRAASMFFAALTIAGSTATAAAASDIVKILPGINNYYTCENCDKTIYAYEDYFRYDGKYYHNTCRADADDTIIVGRPSCSTILKPTYEYVTTYVPVVEGGFIYKEGDTAIVVNRPTVTVKPGCGIVTTVKPGTSILKPGFSGIYGGKYYSLSEAKEYLKKYFENNTYSITMNEGDSKTFFSGAYFISSDPEVAYYDYKTGKIIANEDGACDIYVCTSGGVPFFCLRVSVLNNRVPADDKPYLKVEASEWQLSVGDTSKITVTASDGKVYNDIKITVDFGSENAVVSNKKSQIRATGNGPIVVRAYSKSNPSIRGEALLFVGSYKNYIYDGYWTVTDDGIRVDWWGCDDVVVNYNSYIAGWIQSGENGLLIPVVKKYDAINEDGDKTTILTSSVVDYTDLLMQAYGCKEDLVSLIIKYNLYKNGLDESVVTIGDIDYSKLFLGQIFKALN